MSRCNAVEHLESSGTKGFMNRPIVCKSCDQEDRTEKHETNNRYFSSSFYTFSGFFYLSEGFKACLEFFKANIS